jgi:hypothetical protein
MTQPPHDAPINHAREAMREMLVAARACDRAALHFAELGPNVEGAIAALATMSKSLRSFVEVARAIKARIAENIAAGRPDPADLDVHN